MMKEILNWLVDNWSIIVAAIAIIVVAIVAIQKFRKMPTEAQKAKVKQCLLNWVIEAERDLGGGTGKVKLSRVYGWFVTAFPFLKNFIPFEVFSTWVDEALDEMREMLATNASLKTVVEGNLLEATTEVINMESEVEHE